MTNDKKQEFINKVADKLAGYEQERKRRILNLIISEIIMAIISYISFQGFIFFVTNNHSIIGIICLLVLFFAVAYFFINITESDKEFKTYLKNKCKKSIIKTFELETIKGEQFSKEILIKSNLFSTFNTTEYDDIIEGKHNNVAYKMAETKLVLEGSKSSHTIFKGIIISFKSNKKISAETLVTTKGDNNIRNYLPFNKASIFFLILLTLLPIAFLIIIFNKTHSLFSYFMIIDPSSLILWAFISIIIYLNYKKKKKMQDVKLEDLSFEKNFNVYTKDQIEARYLLTTAFMERLKNIETAFGTKQIKCSFFDDNIIFAISTKKDLFELCSLFRPLSDTRYIENFYDEIISIQKLIDHFKLSENTGL